MRRLLQMSIALIVVAGVSVVPSAGANKEHKNKYANDEHVTQVCESEGGEVSYDGPLTLWPPNHKYNHGTITATADNPEDEVTLTTEAAHDQANEDGSEWNGAGNTPVEGDITTDDPNPATGTGSASQTYDIRAERSGQRSALDEDGREGRHYLIAYEATFGDSEPCVGSFQIFVPHDMRPSNR
ncbi:MAG TPA: hypothetical protein VGB83_08405 [Actinomycetota bacterium]